LEAAGAAGGRVPPAGTGREQFDRQREALRRTLDAAPGAHTDPDVEARRRRLQDWRVDAARHTGVPPKVLLHDATLAAMAERCPATPDELLTMPGFGPVKASRYGPVLLDLLGHHEEIA
jgi:ATP-dependent DNA helicase RecQ